MKLAFGRGLAVLLLGRLFRLLPLWTVAFVVLGLPRVRAQPSLQLLQTVALEGVEGRFDHLSADVKGERLFVAALGNNSVEVIDLKAGKRIQTLRGVQKPAGVLYVADTDRLYVASGGDNSLKIFNGASYELLKSLTGLDDADNIRYDAKGGLVYVGYGKGALAIVDPAQATKIGDIAMRGHPESFQLQTQGKFIFVNVPNARQVALIDRARRGQVGGWSMRAFPGNFPMALDESNHRLLVGCHEPPVLVVLNSESGTLIGDVPISGDTDDLFYDASRKRIYISCGQGFVDVIQQRSPDRYEHLEKIPTAAGARTSYFIRELKKFAVAVPHKEAQKAEIRIYEPK